MRARRWSCADMVAPAAVSAHEGDGAVDRFVADLARELRGPRALRRDVLAEVRDGLHDAADALGDRPDAAERAVADFGTVAELAPLHQAELTAAQARRTAWTLTLLLPALLLGWDLLWRHGVAWTSPAPPPPVVGALTRALDVVSALGAGAGLVLLGLTLRRRAAPHRAAAAAATAGLTSVVLCLGAALAVNLANARATAALLASSPVAVLAFAASVAAAAVIATSAVRSLRLARPR